MGGGEEMGTLFEEEKNNNLDVILEVLRFIKLIFRIRLILI